MLDKHLRATVRPVANEKNVIRWKDYRVSVLADRLFRVERSAKGEFCDAATQGVWFRDMAGNKFSVKRTETELTVKTGAATLVLNEVFEKSYVILKGKAVKLDNKGNLLGTFRTLDAYEGDTHVRTGEKVKMGMGVCSRTGVAVLDDSESLLLDENGELCPRGEAFDKYIFAYGHNFRAAVQALYMIEGATPMIPRYALGNWWSRYYAYTQKEYLQLLNRFEEHDVPLAVATIDMDWHYSDHLDEEVGITASGRNTEFYGYNPKENNGWTGYSWNKNLFPDYKGFLKTVQEKNLKVTLNLHPAQGVRWFEDCYEEFAKAMGKDPATGERVPFDVSSPEFLNEYFKILHKPYERDGVDFWWIDWQQGTESGMKNLDPLWALNHYHYLDNASDHEHGLILSRYCGAGAHRYPLGFTGDTTITWKTLDYLPYFTLTASNVGYTWWSHDIGGHFAGNHDEELYARSVQFGAFNPINRMHSTITLVNSKEPWTYAGGCGEIAMRYLRLRHQLIPYLYTAAYRTHAEGVALVEPMYYDYPESSEAYKVKNQYMFGGQLMVAPITAKCGKDGFASTKVWFPKGVWTDIFTGERYEGERMVTVRRTLENMPVFAKSGAIVPLDGSVRGNGCPLPQVLRVKVFCGDGGYELYEDRGKKSAITRFTACESKGNQTLTFTVAGDKGVVPAGRKMIVEFANVTEGALSVSANGQNVDFREIIADHPTAEISDLSAGTEYTVTLCYQKGTRLEYYKENAAARLMCAREEAGEKQTLIEQILACKTEKEYVETVLASKVSHTTKNKLLETVIL